MEKEIVTNENGIIKILNEFGIKKAYFRGS